MSKAIIRKVLTSARTILQPSQLQCRSLELAGSPNCSHPHKRTGRVSLRMDGQIIPHYSTVTFIDMVLNKIYIFFFKERFKFIFVMEDSCFCPQVYLRVFRGLPASRPAGFQELSVEVNCMYCIPA
jgi:hypothetical protein